MYWLICYTCYINCDGLHDSIFMLLILASSNFSNYSIHKTRLAESHAEPYKPCPLPTGIGILSQCKSCTVSVAITNNKHMHSTILDHLFTATSLMQIEGLLIVLKTTLEFLYRLLTWTISYMGGSNL